MTDIPRLITQMRAAGATADVILSVIETVCEQEEVRKAQNRARQAKCRNNKRNTNVTVTLQSRDNPLDKEKSPTPPKEIKPPLHFETTSLREESINPIASETKKSDFPKASFELWWAKYPRKTAKGAARKAFDKLDRTGVVAWDVLLAATERYIADPTRKPEFTPHPATWLNQERWLDEGLAPATNVIRNEWWKESKYQRSPRLDPVGRYA